MINNVYCLMALMFVLVIAEKKHNFKIDNRKNFTRGYICNYEIYHLNTLQYVIYTCASSFNCHPQRDKKVLRFPELDFDNCPYVFHPPAFGDIMCCHPADNDDIRPFDMITLPDKPKYLPGFRSGFKCNEYAELGCLNSEYCPYHIPRRRTISKGYATAIGKYPYLAMVGRYNEETFEQVWFCLGSIISEKYILSAASCTATTNFRNASHVRVGVEKLCQVGVDCPLSLHTQVIPIERHIPHPKQLLSWYYHDIMLFKLSKDIKFNRVVRPACVFNDMSRTLSSGRFAMYDELSEEEREERALKVSFSTLHEAEMNVIADSDCMEERLLLGDNRLIDNIVDAEYMFCAGIEGDVNEPCNLQYDDEFGGPIVAQEETPRCIWKVFGVMGWFQPDPGCGRFIHNVFTRVPYYVGWIEDVVWKDFDLFEKGDTLPNQCYDDMRQFTEPIDGRCVAA